MKKNKSSTVWLECISTCPIGFKFTILDVNCFVARTSQLTITFLLYLFHSNVHIVFESLYFYRSGCHYADLLNGRAPVFYGGWIQYGGRAARARLKRNETSAAEWSLNEWRGQKVWTISQSQPFLKFCSLMDKGPYLPWCRTKPFYAHLTKISVKMHKYRGVNAANSHLLGLTKCSVVNAYAG